MKYELREYKEHATTYFWVCVATDIASLFIHTDRPLYISVHYSHYMQYYIISRHCVITEL